ncbi:hypothetical protein HDU79_008569 [Rhizoclosmatium sp. JEL0117]|nr:hypothetical protein HDU79_008569 [Rhizoclosmatium sp. JEL0117]
MAPSSLIDKPLPPPPPPSEDIDLSMEIIHLNPDTCHEDNGDLPSSTDHILVSTAGTFTPTQETYESESLALLTYGTDIHLEPIHQNKDFETKIRDLISNNPTTRGFLIESSIDSIFTTLPHIHPPPPSHTTNTTPAIDILLFLIPLSKIHEISEFLETQESGITPPRVMKIDSDGGCTPQVLDAVLGGMRGWFAGEEDGEAAWFRDDVDVLVSIGVGGEEVCEAVRREFKLHYVTVTGGSAGADLQVDVVWYHGDKSVGDIDLSFSVEVDEEVEFDMESELRMGGLVTGRDSRITRQIERIDGIVAQRLHWLESPEAPMMKGTQPTSTNRPESQYDGFVAQSFIQPEASTHQEPVPQLEQFLSTQPYQEPIKNPILQSTPRIHASENAERSWSVSSVDSRDSFLLHQNRIDTERDFDGDLGDTSHHLILAELIGDLAELTLTYQEMNSMMKERESQSDETNEHVPDDSKPPDSVTKEVVEVKPHIVEYSLITSMYTSIIASLVILVLAFLWYNYQT